MNRVLSDKIHDVIDRKEGLFLLSIFSSSLSNYSPVLTKYLNQLPSYCTESSSSSHNLLFEQSIAILLHKLSSSFSKLKNTTMNISTNNNSKFLSVIAMAVFIHVIFVPTTEAAGARVSVRRRRFDEKKDNRVLKSTKADSTPTTTSATATNSNPVASSPTGPPPTPDTTGTSVFAWEARCASQSNSTYLLYFIIRFSFFSRMNIRVLY